MLLIAAALKPWQKLSYSAVGIGILGGGIYIAGRYISILLKDDYKKPEKLTDEERYKIRRYNLSFDRFWYGSLTIGFSGVSIYSSRFTIQLFKNLYNGIGSSTDGLYIIKTTITHTGGILLVGGLSLFSAIAVIIVAKQFCRKHNELKLLK
jgi:hypothetical protein